MMSLLRYLPYSSRVFERQVVVPSRSALRRPSRSVSNLAARSGRSHNFRSFATQRPEFNNKDEKDKDNTEKNQSTGTSGSFFKNLRQQIETEISKNPELKKSFQEVKESIPFSNDKANKKDGKESNLFNKAAKTAKDAKERLQASTQETAKKSSKAADEYAEKTAKVANEYSENARQTLSSFLEQLNRELKAQMGFKKEDESRKEDQHMVGEKAEAAHGSTTSQEPPNRLQQFQERMNVAFSRVLSMLPQSFGNDDKSWEDAFRSVFGLRLKKRKKPSEPSMKKEEQNTSELKWYEAVDEATSEIYYYTKDGKTTWEKPDELKTPEELAEEWSKNQGKAAPTFLEKQIKEKTERISVLETERDKAMADSDMEKYKELNMEIRSLRKEIEALSAQANTTAVVNVERKKGAWEQFGETLRDTPILKGLFGFGEKLSESEAAKKARDVAEDARQAWETSQNPWIYRAYNAWESVFAETEMGEAIRELRKLDPEFTLENMLIEMEEELVPKILKAYLKGDVKTLEKWCSEAAAAAIKAAITQRQAAGRKMDENILSIDHMQVAAAKVVEKMGPLVVIQFMVQQIDCMYDLKGNVVDGSDDRVAAVFYAFALGREYNEEEQELQWKIKEFAIVGTQPWT